MRRLPVYLVVDSSESTIGAANAAINLGIRKTLESLRKNPYALETVWLSTISFDAKARVLTPLTDIVEFQAPNIEIRPGTALGAAIDLLSSQMKKEVRRATNDDKGDFRPLVFFFTDGVPTDDWRAPLARFKALRPRPANVYAIGCGDEDAVDYSLLNQLADKTFKIEGDEDDLASTFAKLFVWLSASIQSASQGVGDDFFSKKENMPEGVELVPDDCPAPRPTTYPPFAFFHTLCSAKRKKVLVRFRYDKEECSYHHGRAFPVPASFFDDGVLPPSRVSNDLVSYWSSCPCCGNPYWSRCGECGAIFCNEEPGAEVTCPSCRASLGGIGDGDFELDSSAG